MLAPDEVSDLYSLIEAKINAAIQLTYAQNAFNTTDTKLAAFIYKITESKKI